MGSRVSEAEVPLVRALVSDDYQITAIELTDDSTFAFENHKAFDRLPDDIKYEMEALAIGAKSALVAGYNAGYTQGHANGVEETVNRAEALADIASEENTQPFTKRLAGTTRAHGNERL